MAIIVKNYTLATQVTSDLFPERVNQINRALDEGIAATDRLKWVTQYITNFDGTGAGWGKKGLGFNRNYEADQKVKDWVVANEMSFETEWGSGKYDFRAGHNQEYKENAAWQDYFFANLALSYYPYKSFYDSEKNIGYRKQFDRQLFNDSKGNYDQLKTFFYNILHLPQALPDNVDKAFTYTGGQNTTPASKFKQASKELQKSSNFNKLRFNEIITFSDGTKKVLNKSELDYYYGRVLYHYRELKKKYNDPKFGVTRFWLKDDAQKGPYTTIGACLVKTEDDARKLFGVSPKDNPTETEIKNGMVEAKKANVDLSYNGCKHIISKLHEKGTPLGFVFTPNDIPESDKTIRNTYSFSEGVDFIAGDATDAEKLDFMVKQILRKNTDKTIHPNPKGNDASIAASTVGPEVPNVTDQLESLKLQQTPPELVVVDENLIREQTEAFLEQQNAGLNSVEVSRYIVDGLQLSDYDEIVGVGPCFIKEVINGVTQSATYSSSIDGIFKIPEFGRDSVLRIIPPPPYKQKDFGPNLGDENQIDFTYEMYTNDNPVNTSGGQQLEEEPPIEELVIVEEEETDPRQVGGTVINSLTSEPIVGIDVIYGIGNRKVKTTTNGSGEFIITITEPRINQLGQRLDKITEQIKKAQERTIDPQKTFFAGQQFINEGLDKLGSSGIEQLENYANDLQGQDTAFSQYSSNIITGNIGQITNTETPGVLSDTGAFQAGQSGTNFINEGIQGYNSSGGVVGLYGRGIQGLNNLSAKTADVTQKGINYLVDPLNSNTFQDAQNFKNKFNELQGKLPGRKIVIKGTGKVYKKYDPSTNTTTFSREVLSEIKYRTKRITPYDSENNVIQDLGIIKITPRTIGIRNSLRQIKYQDKYGNPDLLKLQKFKEKIRDFTQFQALKREKLKQEIKRQILPNLITQVLVPLGVYYLDPILQNVKTDVEEVIRENDILCPNQKTLKKLIKTVNILNKALTGTYTAINGASNAVKAGNKIIKVLQISIEVYQFVPFIHAIGTPDTITKINSDKIQKTKNDLEKGKVINENILLWTMEISSLLSKAVDVVKVAQTLLEKCLQETKPDRSKEQPDLALDPITADLQEINEFVNEQVTTPIVANSMEINGFSLEIEEETINNNPSIPSQQQKISIPRKRAIAVNPNGIVAIRGEYSFTADPDILIEELRFYIQVNDLKAF